MEENELPAWLLRNDSEVSGVCDDGGVVGCEVVL